jgi:hypothetical protein
LPLESPAGVAGLFKPDTGFLQETERALSIRSEGEAYRSSIVGVFRTLTSQEMP